MSVTMGSTLPARLTEPYDPVARAFHWIVVLMLTGQFLVALVLASVLPESAAGTLVAWHFSLGSAIWIVMLARLAWRLLHPPPPPPEDLSPLLQAVSRATHWGFYAILLVLPVLGWFAASAYGSRVHLAGLIPLPLAVPKDDPFGKLMQTVHPTVALCLLALVALHVSGALYHKLVKKDGVMGRMWPGQG